MITPPPHLMLRVAHASHDGSLYLKDVEPLTGIIELVRDSQLETCTAEHRIVFWFTRSTNKAFTHHNDMATQLLLATTSFTARNVPILRGNIVITGVDAIGGPATLTGHQIDLLTTCHPSKNEQRILIRRFTRDTRTQRHRALAERTVTTPQRRWPR